MNGHELSRAGGMGDEKGPNVLWVMLCRCGYGELAPAGTTPYIRGYMEAEKLKNDQKGGINVGQG